MFSDSEHSSSEDDAEAPAVAVLKSSAAEDVEKKKKKRVRYEVGPRPSHDIVSKIKKTFKREAPGKSAVLNKTSASVAAQEPCTGDGDHWNAKTISQAKRRGAELRANPSGLDGRAAYERESMHGRSMVLSVGPSSLPRACRVTKSKIPAANASW